MLLFHFELPDHFHSFAEYKLVQLVLPMKHLHAVGLEIVGMLADLQVAIEMVGNHPLPLVVVATAVVTQFRGFADFADDAVAEVDRHYLEVGHLVFTAVLLDVVYADLHLLEEAAMHSQML